MLEVQNTPFPTYGSGLGPIKRLWRFLIHQEAVQCMFIRYIFGKSKPAGGSIRGGGTEAFEEGSRYNENSILTSELIWETGAAARRRV